MRQVKSQAIRTSVIQDWRSTGLSSVGVSEAQARQAELRIDQLLKSVSAFPISFSIISTGVWDGLSVISTFYKYIQRGRYRRHILHLIHTNNQVALSLPNKIKASQEYKLHYLRLSTLRHQLIRTFNGAQVDLDVKNIFAFQGKASRLDLLTLQKYYVFNRYKNLMYLLDLIQVVQLTARLGAAPLLGDIVSKGLIRNRRKGQRRFIRLIQAVVDHARSGAFTQYRPDGWRLELYGKLDGQLRAKRHLLTFGHVSYQELPENLEYVQRTINTKFGSFGLKLWVHPSTIDNTTVVQNQLQTPRLQNRTKTKSHGRHKSKGRKGK